MDDGAVQAIDLGGTQVRAALVDGAQVLARLAEPTDVRGGPEAVLAQVRRLAAPVASERARPRALGVSCPGHLDTDAGTDLSIPTLPGWEDLPLRDLLARETGLPVCLENDGIAAAYGEWRHGAGRGLRHRVYVTVSTGIGGGVVVDGRLVHGRRGMAGHIGHLPIDPNGRACACGAPGCFEAVVSGTALARDASEAVGAHSDGLLAALAGAEPTARDVAEAARLGFALAQRLIEGEARWLGIGFVALLHAYSPQAVVMGGVALAFDLLEPGIRATVRARALPAFREVPVLRAALGEDSGLVGAAALARDTLPTVLPVGD